MKLVLCALNPSFSRAHNDAFEGHSPMCVQEFSAFVLFGAAPGPCAWKAVGSPANRSALKVSPLLPQSNNFKKLN